MPQSPRGGDGLRRYKNTASNFKFYSREIIADIAARIGVNLLLSGSRLPLFCGLAACCV